MWISGLEDLSKKWDSKLFYGQFKGFFNRQCCLYFISFSFFVVSFCSDLGTQALSRIQLHNHTLEHTTQPIKESSSHPNLYSNLPKEFKYWDKSEILTTSIPYQWVIKLLLSCHPLENRDHVWLIFTLPVLAQCYTWGCTKNLWKELMHATNRAYYFSLQVKISTFLWKTFRIVILQGEEQWMDSPLFLHKQLCQHLPPSYWNSYPQQ